MTKELLENYVRNFGGSNMDNKYVYTIKIDTYEVQLKLDEPEYVDAICKLLKTIRAKYPSASVYMKDEEYDDVMINAERW